MNTMAKSNVSVEVIGKIMVAYCTAGEAGDEETQKMVTACNAPGVTKFFSVTSGVISMTAKQRADGAKIMFKMERVVIVSDNSITRGAARAIGWLGVKLRVFGPDNMEEAVRALELTPMETGKVRTAIERMKRSATVAA